MWCIPTLSNIHFETASPATCVATAAAGARRSHRRHLRRALASAPHGLLDDLSKYAVPFVD